MRTFLAMLRDESGAAAVEYALIAVLCGVALVAASALLGAAVKVQMSIHATGPDGTLYFCKTNCEFDYMDYCAAAAAANSTMPAAMKPTFSPTPPPLPKKNGVEYCPTTAS